MNLKDPTTQKILIGVLVTIVISYIYFGTQLLPFCYPVRKAKINQLEVDYAKLSADLEKARQMVGRLEQIEAEYARLHEQWLSAQKMLPAEAEMPDLLRSVTTAGNKAGIDFMLFQPGAATAHEFYKSHPIKVRVRGGYHQLGIFLSRLANMPRIVNVASMNIKTAAAPRKGSRGKSGGKEAVIADFTLTAYTLSEGARNEAAATEED